ncbi:uncharacterized protein PAC_17219 [Phialocephala subalpina]|uniref:CCHC-type domain-containing protein n=1 Tax=Phialocephala subalpina TaxID=576137 RepID=A0A1L7XQK3_9HELO|nr:uncharacterized protein PAC_17219 [Phialocephala subalpina]
MEHWKTILDETKETALVNGNSLSKIEHVENEARKHAVVIYPHGPEDAREYHTAYLMYNNYGESAHIVGRFMKRVLMVLSSGRKEISLEKSYNLRIQEIVRRTCTCGRSGWKARENSGWFHQTDKVPHNLLGEKDLRTQEFGERTSRLINASDEHERRANEAEHRADEAERRVKQLSSRVENLQYLMKYNGPGGYAPVCYNCGAMGHSEVECVGACGACRMSDHVRTGCDDTFHSLLIGKDDVVKAVIKQEVKDELKPGVGEGIAEVVVVEQAGEAKEVIRWGDYIG